MTKAVYKKLDIAYEYLETASRLYVEGKAYFSAFHLAAAAQELFGQHLLPDKKSFQAIKTKSNTGTRMAAIRP
jgi:hypothetical protein